ncbi:TackOD1 domain-containing metal-binding protein [Crocinitomix catalasitica]|uniref:TackOD1 domain-containing metal-binding protein n=1 Tax=Crocinitomix catalasitica TaxID=184607 RepID=UPI000482BFB1|nr:hypothetical protein [Crocinitomix catalasitica]
MGQAIHHSENRGTRIEYAGHSFLHIKHLESLNIEDVKNHSAVIIETRDLDYVRMIVSRIRGNIAPDIYLKPIFLQSRNSINDLVLENLVDGRISNLDKVASLVELVEENLNRVQDLTFANSISFEAQMITKMITLMYTKDQKSLLPIPYIYSSINFAYPLLSVNFSETDEHAVLNILDIAESEGLFRSEYYDRIYLCNQCSSSHLSYREVCPKCSSSNTKSDDIIHHFPCGYVGPMQDFKNEIDDKLDCPKCNKRLRHIGVDYDKPSVIHECKNCSHTFQDFFVNAKCLSCGSDRSVEQLKSKIIKSYFLTKKGESAAIKGFVTTTKDIDEIFGTIKFDTFKTMLKYEIERLKQTEGSSNICAIYIRNSSLVYSKLGSTLQKGLLKDLISVIRSNIRSSDVISFVSSSTIILSMNEIPNKISNKIMGNMVRLLEELIASTFKKLDVQFEYKVVALDHHKPYEEHITELTIDFI